MSDIYDFVPSFEDSKYLLRFAEKKDAEELLEIYGDRNSLPFFNSDNCHGDNFYYPTIEKMKKAVDFWLSSYQSKWFVRWVIVKKSSGKIIGSIELFHREADDYFNHTGLLRLDLKNEFEKADVIGEIAGLILQEAYDLFETDRIITKVPLYAVERKAAFEKLGFVKSDEFLIGTLDGYAYKDYWDRKK